MKILDNQHRWYMRLLLQIVVMCVPVLMRAQPQALPNDAVCPDWHGHVPEVVYPDTGMVALYYKTWEVAAGRVRRGPEGLPASPYLDENCYEDQIWIWDTCFMTLFSRYCPSVYPGKESMMNLYAPLHDHRPTPLKIHLRDNPPIFAWVESEYYNFTGDRQQAEMVMQRKRYLQRHFNFFNTVPCGSQDTLVTPAYNPIRRRAYHAADGTIEGYSWYYNSSGMDNTPRGRDAGGADSILWVDAICQQALSARCMARMARQLGMKHEAARWQRTYDTLRTTINRLYWDERDGFYYDIHVRTHQPCRIKTIASYWALLAGIPTPVQARRMARYLQDARYMGGTYPFTSLSRDDVDFDAATGNYWRGGVWLPMAYMATKALEQYGFYALADTLARRTVQQQLATYQSYVPHTIWETYSPSANLPSTEHGHRVRPDFCGWSALGPISLFIENVLGFRQINALTYTVRWDLNPRQGVQGLRQLHFGDVTCAIIYNPVSNTIFTDTNKPFTLMVNGQRIKVKSGGRSYKYKPRTHTQAALSEL